jgi:hypothetical protein
MKLMGEFLQLFFPIPPKIPSPYPKSNPGCIVRIQSQYLQNTLTCLYRRHCTVGWAGAWIWADLRNACTAPNYGGDTPFGPSAAAHCCLPQPLSAQHHTFSVNLSTHKLFSWLPLYDTIALFSVTELVRMKPTQIHGKLTLFIFNWPI